MLQLHGGLKHPSTEALGPKYKTSKSFSDPRPSYLSNWSLLAARRTEQRCRAALKPLAMVSLTGLMLPALSESIVMGPITSLQVDEAERMNEYKHSPKIWPSVSQRATEKHFCNQPRGTGNRVELGKPQKEARGLDGRARPQRQGRRPRRVTRRRGLALGDRIRPGWSPKRAIDSNSTPSWGFSDFFGRWDLLAGSCGALGCSGVPNKWAKLWGYTKWTY